MENWICTDPDTNQYGRKIGDRKFEFKQDMAYPDGTVVQESDVVSLDEFTKEDIEDHISAFGYTYDGLIAECGKEQAEWLFAECIFELTAF